MKQIRLGNYFFNTLLDKTSMFCRAKFKISNKIGIFEYEQNDFIYASRIDQLENILMHRAFCTTWEMK